MMLTSLDENKSKTTNITRMIMFKNTNNERRKIEFEEIDSGFTNVISNIDKFKNSISSSCDIMWKSLCCSKSDKRHMYKRTIAKIRYLLDVNTIIKMILEFQFLKNILFNQETIELFSTFSNLKNIKDDSVKDIRDIMKDIIKKNEENPGEYSLDYNAMKFFLANFMKSN